MKTTTSSIEPLESRIAPAAVFSYTDVDGDLVTVKTSKGTNAQLAAILTFVSSGVPAGRQLQQIDFSASPLDATAKPVFAGTDLTITAVPQDLTPGDADKTKSGDGLVNIGRIDATSSDGDGIDLDLGAIKIAGDLGQITAGTGSALVPAVKSMSVHTMGAGGLSTGALTEMSDLNGAIGSISVQGDWHNVRMTTLTGGPVASVSIGGSLLEGVLSVASDLGSVKVTGDLLDGLFFSNGATKNVSIGGSVQGSGGLNALGAMGQVKIGGDLNDGISSNSTIGSISIGGSYALSNPNIAQISIHAAGRIGSIHIGGDFNGVPAVSFISGSSARITAGGDIGSVRIDGSIIGGSDDSSASINTTGGIGTVKVGGDIKGGAGQKSGSIFASQAINSLTVGGSIVGGNDTNTSNGVEEGLESGAILIHGVLGTVKIGGSIIGGNAPFSGSVGSDGGITSITVGGSIIGGPDTGEFAPAVTGAISTGGDIGTAKVGHDIVGSNQSGSLSPNDTGVIEGRRLGNVTVGGSVIAGAGLLTRCGAIEATYDIGTLVVKGSLIGNTSNHVDIFASGLAGAPVNNDIAIKSLTVGGRVEHAWIFGGVDNGGAAVNGNAQIGAVSVGGDWIDSSLASGVTSTDGYLGDGNDAAFGGGTRSKIASITIKGQVLGDGSTNHTSGFFAETIGAFKYDGIALALKAGASNDTFALGAAHPVGPSLSTANADGFAVHVFEV